MNPFVGPRVLMVHYALHFLTGINKMQFSLRIKKTAFYFTACGKKP
jgi:hypothetical protein